MTRTRTFLAAGLSTLALGTALLAPPAADAAQPLKHTVYRGTGGQPGVDTTVTFKLKVGKDRSRIKKAVVEVSCPTAHNTVVFKNVRIVDGYFTKDLHFPGTSIARFELTGQVLNKHKLDVSFQTADSGEPCGNYVMDGTAHD